MKKKSNSRRQFIRNTGLGILGAGLADHESLAAHSENSNDNPPKIKKYKRLGRTGAMVSDIGSGEPVSSVVLKAVID
jgi:hypothetical protein